MEVKNLVDEIRNWLDDAQLFLAEWRDETGELAILFSVTARSLYRISFMICYYTIRWPGQEARHAKALVPLMKKFATLKSMPLFLRDAIALWAARLATELREQEEIHRARAAEIPK